MQKQTPNKSSYVKYNKKRFSNPGFETKYTLLA